MTDTVRAYSALVTLLADNTSRAISPQDLRDMLVSVLGVVPTISKTANYTATESDEVILCNATSGIITITLPAVATTRVGKRYVIIKTDAVNNVVADGNASETINGATTVTLTTQYWSLVIVNSGSAWFIESKYAP